MSEEKNGQSPAATRNPDEVALDLMKFVATTTGYGRGTGQVGFTGKGTKSPEEYADALLELFERCRKVVGKPVGS